LEAGRWKSLAVAAQASGRLDFCKADSNDLKWLIKEKLILDEIERERITDVYRTGCLLHASAAGASNKEIYEHHFKQADKRFKRITEILLPYVSKSQQIAGSKAGIGETPEEMRENWAKVFGNPDDPEVAARIKATIEELSKRSQVKQSEKTESSRIKVRTKVKRK